MMFQNAARVIAILSVTMAVAQTTPLAPTVPGGADAIGQTEALASQRMASLSARRSNGMQAQTTPRQRLEDLQNTVNQMHAVLKQMQAKAAKSPVKDSLAKTNFDMWGLMVGHLDKELQELKVAVAQHEDMEARRAALYRQADAKTQAQAQAARAAEATKFGVVPPTSAPSGQSPAGQPAPGQSVTSPANNTSSPN